EIVCWGLARRSGRIGKGGKAQGPPVSSFVLVELPAPAGVGVLSDVLVPPVKEGVGAQTAAKDRPRHPARTVAAHRAVAEPAARERELELPLADLAAISKTRHEISIERKRTQVVGGR